MTPAYLEGRRAGKANLAPALNPFPPDSAEHEEWRRGWIRETGEALLEQHEARRRRAQILPHPALTALQCETVCARNALALAHRGNARLELIPTAAQPEPMLRIAHNQEIST